MKTKPKKRPKSVVTYEVEWPNVVEDHDTLTTAKKSLCHGKRVAKARDEVTPVLVRVTREVLDE